MGKAAIIVAAISIGVLLVYYALVGFLGAGPVQKGEVPLWLRSVEAASGILQATATGLASIYRPAFPGLGRRVHSVLPFDGLLIFDQLRVR